MLYNTKNAAGAKVYDVEAGVELTRVLEVNTGAGWVKVGSDPCRIDAHGSVAGERIRFASIHVIQGIERSLCLFHCYGRVN